MLEGAHTSTRWPALTNCTTNSTQHVVLPVPKVVVVVMVVVAVMVVVVMVVVVVVVVVMVL
jgi:hypothetical protein